MNCPRRAGLISDKGYTMTEDPLKQSVEQIIAALNAKRAASKSDDIDAEIEAVLKHLTQPGQ
jgi:hypothetical protein